MTEYGGMFEFHPTEDTGTATSTGNEIIPQVISLTQFNSNFDDYECELVKVQNVTFADTGTFENGIVYEIEDSNGITANFRTTFYDVDFIGTNIPLIPVNIVCIPNSRTEGEFLSARMLSDFGDADADENTIPVNETVLMGNYPNPFNPTTTVRFALKENANVSLRVYNIKGQLVKTLVDGRMDAGIHDITWEGDDNNSRQVGSGVYMFRMITPDYEKTGKALLLK